MLKCSNVNMLSNTAKLTVPVNNIEKVYFSNPSTLNVIKEYCKYYKCCCKFCQWTYVSFNCNRFYKVD